MPAYPTALAFVLPKPKAKAKPSAVQELDVMVQSTEAQADAILERLK
jgi:hypothetical protein